MSNNKTKRPLIGISLDHELKGEYSAYPHYALRDNYFKAVYQAGGLPIGLPYHSESAEEYFALVDGFIIAGGNFDIPPSMYGADFVHQTVTTKDERTKFEFAITALAIKNNKPILGICGGEQLINVVCGGTLIQDIATEIPNALQHEVKNREVAAHDISITKGSLLHRIAGAEVLGVNSSHHQAVKNVGKSLKVNSVAPDGVIEGIEHENHKFCLGVQWHPEYLVTDFDKAIFDNFIKSTR
jgi:putative glutamine amidotransferase